MTETKNHLLILAALVIAVSACQSTPTPPQQHPQEDVVVDDEPAEPTIRKGETPPVKVTLPPKPAVQQPVLPDRPSAREALREERLARAINKALEYEINGQNLLAIRTYRSAAKFANTEQRNDLESKARKLLMTHLRLEKSHAKDATVVAAVTPASLRPGEMTPLLDYKTLKESDLVAILKKTTPTERLREATGGYNSFLAQAAAADGQSEESKNRAYARLSVFRRNEAQLARLRKQRTLLREARRSSYKDALYLALSSADEGFAIADYLALFKLQDQLLSELLAAAKIVYRTQVVTRSPDGRVLAVGRDSQTRPANTGECQILRGPHHKAQLRALKKARSFTPESVALLLRSENLRQQRVMLAASNDALQRRSVLGVYDLARCIESHP